MNASDASEPDELAPRPRARVNVGRVVALLALLGASTYWVLLALAIVDSVREPQPHYARLFFYSGMVLVALAGILVWGWRRLLTRPRVPRLGTDGRVTFAPEAVEDIGAEPRKPHVGLSGEQEPPRRW